MAIKVYGDKIVYPDNSEQTTAFTGAVEDVYTKEQIDEQQDAQDVKIDKNTSDLTNVYTKTEVDDSQSAQDTEIAKKVNDAPTDGETYARNNETWVSISDSSGIPDAPVDGAMYGRKDGEWDTVADAGDVYTKTETNTLLDDKADKTTTYTKTEVDAQQNAQDVNIQANADAIADLPAPVDTYTKTEIDTQQNAQDVEIAKKANTADTYTKTQTDTLLDNKANVGDSYTKAETYNNTEIDSKLFEKADKTTTYTKDEVNTSQDAQDVNISGNTSAIGTLSGRVSANEQDIATLQDGIFFSSSYTAEYPDNPNRDPQTGNMYMQDLSAFTYSYADTNQVFLSKTDEQGNVRQFTAVKPDDTIVLNQVESPNYGRYKVVSVNDVGAYVSLVVVFQLGEGTLLDGDTVALQAFPASAGGDSIWTVDELGNAVYDGNIRIEEVQYTGDELNKDSYATVINADTNQVVNTSKKGYRWLVDGGTKLILDKNGDGNGQLRIADLASTTNSNPANVYANSAGQLFMSTGGSGDGIPEAPIDGKQYARQDAEWTEVTGGGSGGGGETVAFRGELNADQTVTANAWNKINLDEASVDTDNAFTESKFQPSVAGYYQVNGAVTQNCSPSSTLTTSALHKNGSSVSQGTDSNSDVSRTSQVSDVIYLNGTTDYLELFGLVKTSGTALIDGNSFRTYLSAVLVSGGSGGGGTGGGLIKQVKQFRKTDTFESTTALPNTTKVTGLTATIKPKSINSKIMVMVTGAVGINSNNYGSAIQLYRGDEQIDLADIRATETNAVMGSPVTGSGWSHTFSVNYLDSPNSTDEVSYELYLGVEDGATAMLGGTYATNVPSTASVPTNIILMEVGESEGGGSGGGSGWKETVLFENEAGQTTNFALSKSYDGFDYLRFDTLKSDGGDLKRSDMFPIDICNKLVIDNYYNFYMYLNCDDKTNFTVVGADNVSLLKVVGINTGTGGGSGDSIWTEEDGEAVYDGNIKVNGMTVGVGGNPDSINTVVGLNALASETTGEYNVAMGREALYSNEDGSSNTAVGTSSLMAIAGANNNTALGADCW